MLTAPDVTTSLWTGHEALSGAYRAGLIEAGVGVDERLTMTVDGGADQVAEATARLLGADDPPTGIYVSGDEWAPEVLRAVRRSGRTIPGDVSVIAVGDQVAEHLDLSTVRLPIRQQASIAGRMLVDLLRGASVETAVTLPPALVVRGSTAPPGA